MKLWHPQKSPNQDINTLPGQWLFYFIAVIGVMVSFLLWYAFILQSNANLEHVLQDQAEHVAKDVDIQLKLRISALKHMAKHLERESPVSDENWQEIAEYLLEYGGFETVVWLNPDLQTTRVASTANKTASTLYTGWIQRYQTEIKKTANTDQIWLSPLLENQPAQEEDIFAVIPVKNAQNQLLGYLVSVIDLAGALDIALYHVDFAVTVSYDNQEIYENNVTKDHSQIAPYSAELSFYGTHWKVTIQPSKRLISTIANHLSGIALTLGICLAVLFGFTARLALLARLRARELDQINLNLKTEIADRIQAEKSKQSLEKAMLQGQKLQAIGTLAGGIAHDFNNILYAIIGYAEMAREDVPEGSLVYDNLGKVLEGSQRGRELIARILAFGRRQLHHDFQPIRLNRAIESVLSFVKPTVPSSVTINFKDGTKGECLIMGNEIQLHQVLVNLINNAVDAMNDTGTITIETALIDANDELLNQLPGMGKSSYCKITVKDTGGGMNEETLERIFEPFYTTKEVGKGSGLGLAIVDAIIEDHQGKIIVTSILGKESIFTIILPVYSPTENDEGI